MKVKDIAKMLDEYRKLRDEIEELDKFKEAIEKIVVPDRSISSIALEHDSNVCMVQYRIITEYIPEIRRKLVELSRNMEVN